MHKRRPYNAGPHGYQNGDVSLLRANWVRIARTIEVARAVRTWRHRIHFATQNGPCLTRGNPRHVRAPGRRVRVDEELAKKPTTVRNRGQTYVGARTGRPMLVLQSACKDSCSPSIHPEATFDCKRNTTNEENSFEGQRSRDLKTKSSRTL